jgi:uncharacterized protein (TIGR02453 family)
MRPFFSIATLKFLRSLKRNNNREWFAARREIYERDVRAPMITLIEQLAKDFRHFAPEIVASPKLSLYRIYRDTRFTEDKTPLKTQVAASFRWRGAEKGRAAGLYVEVAPGWVWMGGGFYRPEPPDLVRIREHIAATFPEIRRITRSAAFTRAVGELDGDRLSRVPRGFTKDAPAADYLKFCYFLAGREFPAEFAASPQFYPTLIATYKAIMPLVRFLNQPLWSDQRRFDAAS